MPALAITDSNNLFGALEFSEKLAKEGIQPIIGAALTLDFGDGGQLAPRGAEAEAGRGTVVLLAKDEKVIAISCIWPPAPGSIRSRETRHICGWPGSRAEQRLLR